MSDGYYAYFISNFLDKEKDIIKRLMQTCKNVEFQKEELGEIEFIDDRELYNKSVEQLIRIAHRRSSYKKFEEAYFVLFIIDQDVFKDNKVKVFVRTAIKNEFCIIEFTCKLDAAWEIIYCREDINEFVYGDNSCIEKGEWSEFLIE